MTPIWTPRLIALDIDGTLCAPGQPVTAPVVAAIQTARRQGCAIVLASGRATFELDEILTALGLDDGFIICSNGAVTASLPHREIIASHEFDLGESLPSLLAHTPDAIIAVEELGTGYRVSRRFPDGELFGRQILTPRSELLHGQAVRAILRDPDATVDDFIALTHKLHLRSVTYSVGYRAWLDLAPEGVTKGSALAELCQTLDIPQTDVLALGDGRNDIEMISWAGLGVAMGQAPDDVKHHADHITLDVHHNGTAHELNRWFRKH